MTAKTNVVFRLFLLSVECIHVLMVLGVISNFSFLYSYFLYQIVPQPLSALVWYFRDEEDVRGNPLVAGFQEDLAPDDELKTSDRSVPNVVLHAELSSDEDVAKPASKPSPSNRNDSLSAGTTSVNKSGREGSDQQIRTIAAEVRRNPVVASVTMDSSEDEVAGSGVVVRRDADISGDELDNQEHQSTVVSSEPVRCAFCSGINLLIL